MSIFRKPQTGGGLFFFLFWKYVCLFVAAKIWLTCSHLKVTNVLHPATSKLLAKILFFQGLAPVNKELIGKSWNGKCPFILELKNCYSLKK